MRSPWFRMAMDLAVAAGVGAGEGWWYVAVIVGCRGGSGGEGGAGNLAASPRQTDRRVSGAIATRNTAKCYRAFPSTIASRGIRIANSPIPCISSPHCLSKLSVH